MRASIAVLALCIAPTAALAVDMKAAACIGWGKDRKATLNAVMERMELRGRILETAKAKPEYAIWLLDKIDELDEADRKMMAEFNAIGNAFEHICAPSQQP